MTLSYAAATSSILHLTKNDPIEDKKFVSVEDNDCGQGIIRRIQNGEILPCRISNQISCPTERRHNLNCKFTQPEPQISNFLQKYKLFIPKV